MIHLQRTATGHRHAPTQLEARRDHDGTWTIHDRDGTVALTGCYTLDEVRDAIEALHHVASTT